MKFKAKPFYAVSLSNGTMARFNLAGEYDTDDKTCIADLKKIKGVTTGKAQKKDIKDSDPEVKDLKALRKEYKAKFGKAPFGAWTEEEILEKLNEEEVKDE